MSSRAHLFCAKDLKVVPDSGTGQLHWLTGSMNIIIKDGKQSYDFAYTLAESK
jgi:Protein of unknown function (DUF3224)